MKKGFLFCLLFVISQANAAMIDFGLVSVGGDGPLIEFNDLITPTTITGDATITLNIKGDLNLPRENAFVRLDGLNLGRILNNNPNDDLFDFFNDEGNEQASSITGVATISELIFSSLISDGFVNLSIDTNRFVNFGNVEISGSIAFTAVPEPVEIVLLGMGLIGLGYSRKMVPVRI